VLAGFPMIANTCTPNLGLKVFAIMDAVAAVTGGTQCRGRQCAVMAERCTWQA
jgi:hypothetical protein